jgi:hypothetical protein
MRILGDDHYDDIEYFKSGWKIKRQRFLKDADHVHRDMEAAGWNHGRMAPLTESKANE